MVDAAGPHAAGAFWARRVLRRRLRSIVLVGLLGATGLALTMAAVAGARRADTSFDRLRDTTDAADAIVFASQVGVFDPDWSAVGELDYVAAAGAFGIPAGYWIDGPDHLDFALDSYELGGFSVAYGEWRTAVDHPVLLEGRHPDQSNPHEAMATAGGAAAGISVGDQFTIHLFHPGQAEDLNAEPAGPEVTVTVVGIGKSTFEHAMIGPDGPGLVLTRAFDEHYGEGITYVSNLMVRFVPGSHDIARLERDARTLLGAERLPVLDGVAAGKRITNATTFEANGMLLFAVAVGLTTLALTGQALSRAVRVATDDVATLRALGLTRGETTVALILPFVPAAAVTAVVGVIGAIALSPHLPIGLARVIEPDPGLYIDGTVLIIGSLVAAMALGVVAGITAWHEAARASRPVGGRGSVVASRLGRVGAPVAMLVGVRLALEPGRGARALSTRPAFVGAIFGVLGVVGGFTLATAIDDVVANPSRVGQSWSAQVSAWGHVWEPEEAAAVHDRAEVSRSADVWRGQVVFDDLTQPTYAVAPRTGDFAFTLMAGRAPAAPGEIALGPATAAHYNIDVGDVVSARTASGTTIALTVVGMALLPQTAHSGYDQGAWITVDQLAAIDPAAVNPAEIIGLVEFTPETDAGEAIAALSAALPRFDIAPPMVPSDVASLHNVRSLPVLFAAFTVLLAIGTMAHVTAGVVRRRRNELAVLRSLGMTSAQTRAALFWQATTLACIGIVIGTPAGLIIGRSIWRWVAASTPLVYAAPVAVLITVAMIPLWLLLGNALALWPGHRAAGIHPAATLRSE